MLKLSFADADSGLRAMLASLEAIDKRTPQACARAINATLRDMQAELIKQIQSAYTVKASNIRSHTKLERASTRRLEGVTRINYKRTPGLINFQARPARPVLPKKARPKEGASVRIEQGEGRKHPREGGQKAFAARLRSGNVHLVVRLDKHLEVLYGPHPVQALHTGERPRKIEATAHERLNLNLRRELEALMAGLSKGAKR